MEKIVDVRVSRGKKQYLVKWKSYGDFDNMWIDASELGNATEAVAEFERSLTR